VSANVVEFSQHVLVAMRRGQGLDVIDNRIDSVLGTSVSPFPPVTGDETGSGERVADENIVGSHRFLGVIRIVAVSKRVSLMEAGLLGRARRGADVASIAASEVDAFSGELIESRRADIRLVIGFTLGLPIRADRAPAHVVDVEIENVGALGFGGCKLGDRRGGKDQSERDERRFHVHVTHFVAFLLGG